uniref:Ran-binding protein 3 n=1 Tax=Scleropages formosus TaxID=113540 RepID=A0A8C9VHZ6_SCLFO
MADLANEEKPAIAPPVFVFQKDKAQKRSADGSSAEDGEDSDKEECGYCPPVKRERTSSLTQFPPSHSVPKNNVFMPSSFCQSPSGNSDSEPEEKSVGFRLKPPTLIHGQAPSAVGRQTPRNLKTLLWPRKLRPSALTTFCSTSAHPGKACAVALLVGFLWTSKWRCCALCQSGICCSCSSQNAAADADGGAKFVFGQNMSERVLSPPKGGNLSVDNGKDAVAAPAPEAPQQEASPEKAGGAVVESLEESAAAYTKATAKRCLLEKVEVITGEESESNVLQIQCKLFVFDKISQSWVERGRGLLRLNDMASTDDGTLQSRLVMRTQGSLRLILNTKLWPQMQVDKASEKSIRITAMDTEDQGVKVFLISASSKDTGQLFAALHHRILALRSRAEQESEARPADPEPQLPQSNEEDSEEEEEEEDVVIAPTLGATGNTPPFPPRAQPACDHLREPKRCAWTAAADLDSDLRRATLKPRMSAFAMFPPGASEGNEAPASGST